MNWPSTTLRELCLPVVKMDPVLTGRDEVRYVDIGGIDGARHALTAVPWIASQDAPSRCRQLLQAGDTVFSTVRPYLEKIAFIDENLDGEFASTGFCVLRPGAAIDPKFLFRFATSRGLLDQVLPRQKGVSYPAVLEREVRDSSVPVPPLAEQRRIVAILDEHISDLDAGLTYLDSAAARVGHLRRAELDRIFGAGTGPVLPLGDLIAWISAGKSFGAAERPAAPGEWGIIKVSAMTWGEFRPDENKSVSADRVDPRFEIRDGDLLVSRANTSDYVGASVLVPAGVRPKLLLSDKSLRVTPQPDVKPEWLWRALQAPSARRQISALATGTKESMRNISQESLKRVVLPVADRSEQDKNTAEFAHVEAAIGRQLTLLASLRARANGLRRSVLAAAFSGRLTGHGSDTDVIAELAEEESA